MLQSLWLIWIVFGMNGYKIQKCFRKEKRVSGDLPCPATGPIDFSITVFVCVRVCKLFFFFVNDFSGTTEPRILKFDTNVG